MKKRKSPIVLVTILAVMASVAFGLQYVWNRTGGAGQMAPPEMADAKPIGAPREAESVASVSSSVKSALGGTSSAPAEGEGRPPRGPGGPGGPSAGPMILSRAPAASGKPEKPKPNSSSTSAQWFDKNSAIGSKN